MVELLEADSNASILEPCAGEGVFVRSLERHGFQTVRAIEIDADLVAKSDLEIEHGSFVSWEPQQQFQAVIGNPPYIRWRNLSESSRDEMKRHSLWGTLFNSLSDYLTVFIASSVELLKPGGELVFITPSFWMHTAHSDPLREWLLERGYFTHIVSFGEAEVFRGVASSIVIFRFVKSKEPATPIRHFRYTGKRKVPSSNIGLGDADLFREEAVPAFRPHQHWTLATSEKQDHLDRFEQMCIYRDESMLLAASFVRRLGDFVDIANGMVSGLDQAFRLPPEKFHELAPTEMNALIRVVKGFQIEPLVSSEFCWYIDIPIGLCESDVRALYPNLVSHLEASREQLELRYDYGRTLPFWEWAFKRSEAYFSNGLRKAVVPCKERLTNKERVRFSLAPPGTVATQDVTAFSPQAGVRESIEYIVAYLSNPAVSDWIRHRGLMKGGVAEFSERPLASIPFRSIDWSNESEVAIHAEITGLIAEYGTTNIPLQNKVDNLISSLPS